MFYGINVLCMYFVCCLRGAINDNNNPVYVREIFSTHISLVKQRDEFNFNLNFKSNVITALFSTEMKTSHDWQAVNTAAKQWLTDRPTLYLRNSHEIHR